jgi:hypothetical protein
MRNEPMFLFINFFQLLQCEQIYHMFKLLMWFMPPQISSYNPTPTKK